MKRKQSEIIDRILDLLTELTDDAPAEKQAETKPMEMLTIKECTEAVKGISEHTIRKLVTQDASATSAPARESAAKSSSASSLCSIIWAVLQVHQINECCILYRQKSVNEIRGYAICCKIRRSGVTVYFGF